MGARFRRLLRATPLACTRSRSGSVAPPGSELALDRDIHPALDRLSDREREVSPTAEAHRDLIGEVPGVPAIEEVADATEHGDALVPCLTTANKAYFSAGLTRGSDAFCSAQLVGSAPGGYAGM